MTVSISKKSASLTIKHAEMSESGKYTCKLKNSVSDVSTEINLTVRGKLDRCILENILDVVFLEYWMIILQLKICIYKIIIMDV